MPSIELPGCGSRCRWDAGRCAAVKGVELLLQVLAAISDNTVAVWDAHQGELTQRLRGHTCRAHVLECHPTDPRLAMSAGYDGQTIVWDLLEGQPLARCETLRACSLKLVCSRPSTSCSLRPHTPPSARSSQVGCEMWAGGAAALII